MDTESNLPEKSTSMAKENYLYNFSRSKVFFEWVCFSLLAYFLGAIFHPALLGILLFLMIPIALFVIIIQGAFLYAFTPKTQYGKKEFRNFFTKRSMLYYFLLFHSIFAFTDAGDFEKYPNLIYREAGDEVGLVSWAITFIFYAWLMVGIIKIYLSTRFDYTPHTKKEKSD